MRFFISLLLFCVIVSMSQVGYSENLLNNPESVVYDSLYDRYLISNTGNGGIIQITDAGDTLVFASPSSSCRGLLIIDANLFVAGEHGIAMIALSSGSSVWTLAILEMVFLNDITTDGNGYLYVTDWGAGRIYKIKISDQTYSTFVSSGLSYPNGIIYDSIDNRLVLVSSENNIPIQAVNLADSSLSTVIDPGFYGLDGIVRDHEGNYYISEWPTNSIYRFEATFSEPPVVVSSGHDGPADIFLNPEDDVLAIPNYNSNTVDFVPLIIGQFTRINDPVLISGAGDSWGCAWIDFDNDGWLDLYRAQLGRSSQLFHNNAGTGFTEMTGNALVDDYFGDHVINGSWADYDNDGYLDVFISSFDEPTASVNYLYEGDGAGGFTRITSGIHVNEPSMSISPSWVDFNRDGRLDLAVANHSGGNFLYRQDDSGFVKITSGDIVTVYGESNSASWCDFDDNGYPDVHYANFFGTMLNQCYLNNGDQVFNSTAGHVVTNEYHSNSGCWGDYDNDGDFDLYVSNGIDLSPDFMYENVGGGILQLSNDSLFDNTLRSSRGAAWADYDNDGDLDLYVVCKAEDDGNLLYNNQGDGTFLRIMINEVVTDADNSMGITWGDYDRDGDLDIYTTYYGSGNGAFYRNNGNDNNWINISCIGTTSNRSAIGAKIRTFASINGVPTEQVRQISAQTSYCGQNSLNVHFGFGNAAIIDTLKIEWPSGIEDIYYNISVNQFVTYTELLCGDANSDSSVNVSDAVYIINYVFVGGDSPDPIESGDANCDGSVNVSDAVYIINYVFVGGMSPCDPNGDGILDC